MIRTIFASNVKSLREHFCMSKTELSRKAKCSIQCISAIEDKNVTPNALTAVMVAKALGTTVEQLFQPSLNVQAHMAGLDALKESGWEVL